MKYLKFNGKHADLKAKKETNLIDAISEAIDIRKDNKLDEVDLDYFGYLFCINETTDIKEVKRMIYDYNNRYAIAAGRNKNI